jgi:DNA-binding PadR family transcriptional regulator
MILSHLQYFIVRLVKANNLSGESIRKEMEKKGLASSLPAFYQIMRRLEQYNLVVGYYKKAMVKNQQVRERWYMITVEGQKALKTTRDFYL